MTPPTTYDSYWDVMSGWPPTLFSHPEYGDVAVHTIAYHKDFLGWIPPDRKYVAAPDSTQTITLKRLAQPGAEGYLLAQIPIGRSRTDFYIIEARLFAGYDDEIPDEAIVIHKVDTAREDRLAQVVDVDNNGDPNDAGAMWTVGEIFTDAENNLQVSIDAAYASGYRVTINTDPTTFSTCIDFLSTSSHLFGPGWNQASVQVEAASECDWSATSNTDWIRVTAGGNNSGPGRVHYTVSANPSPAVRTGTLTIGGWWTFTVTQAGANEVLFEDDMESGTNGWGGMRPGR
ncbi:MAG: BACON domain-containing protein [Desulfurellaceae bacterium]|nr:BACON domain-containing protein [Desulfurellaceae bacterium]